MDGIHDLGGKHGFGPVQQDAHERAFEARWQGAVFTIVNALMRAGIAHNVDYFRHAVERVDPLGYLADGYYGRWLAAAETMLVEAGQLTSAELTDAAVARGADPAARIAARPDPWPDDFSKVPATEQMPTAERPLAQPPRFALGQKVLTQATGVPGHTRLPAYARGAVGEVVACHGGWVFPDSNAHGLGEQPVHLYTVAFSAQTLWGDAGETQLEVCLDLFEPYLEEVS